MFRMKKCLVLFVIVSCFLTPSTSAQKVDKYFQLSTFFKNKGINVHIDFGKDSTLFAFKDESVKEKILLARKFSTTIDVLNYISGLGWTIQTHLQDLMDGGTVGYTFF